MATLSEMITLWWLFFTSQFTFDFIAPKIMTIKGIREIEAFEYENTRSDFKCCDYREK